MNTNFGVGENRKEKRENRVGQNGRGFICNSKLFVLLKKNHPISPAFAEVCPTRTGLCQLGSVGFLVLEELGGRG